jgi:hypothetical protein
MQRSLSFLAFGLCACGAEPAYGRAYSATTEVAAFIAEASADYPTVGDVLAGVEVRVGEEPIAGGELGGVYDAGEHQVRVHSRHACASIQHELAHALLHGLGQYDVLHSTQGVWDGADGLVIRAQRAAGCK